MNRDDAVTMPLATEPPVCEVPAGADLARRFGGVARLYGADALQAFARARVCVIGLGGVGSWTVEALARSGIGSLRLIDLDHVAESNTNRQIHALGDEYGKAKVLAMRERILAINPECRVEAIEEFATPGNAGDLLDGIDVVVDCIDQVSAKAALIAAAVARGVGVVTCGAAGGRIDPTRVRYGDLARVAGDPLLAKLRYRLRRHHGFAREGTRAGRKFGVIAVYSDEPIARPDSAVAAGAALACAGYGSSVAVTAPIGFAAAARVLSEIAAAPRPRPAHN